MRHNLIRHAGTTRQGSQYHPSYPSQLEQARCSCGQWNFTFKVNNDIEEGRMWQSFHNHEFAVNRK